MSDTAPLGLPEAARRLGVSVRVLRRAMRTKKIPAPAKLTATTTLTAEWFSSVQATVEAQPKALGRNAPQKVPAFARYIGTSAWKKHTNRAREYAAFLAKEVSPSSSG